MAKALQRSPGPLPLALKLRMAEIVLRIKERRRGPFGLFIILGWKKHWQRFAITPDASQDVFAGRNIHRRPAADTRRPLSRIADTVLFDGAILIDRHGNILHSGVMIEGLRPHGTAMKIHPGKFKDVSAQFGFKEKVHTRHLTAITASYRFKGTTVFTVSEETGKIHVFEGGKIVYVSPKGKF